MELLYRAFFYKRRTNFHKKDDDPAFACNDMNADIGTLASNRNVGKR